MSHTSSNAGFDTLFFGIPLLGLLVFGYFRLDEIFARKKNQPEHQDAAPRRTRMGFIVEEAAAEDRSVKPLPRRY